MPKQIELLISPQGDARCIHSDDAMRVMRAIGRPNVRRASHVEPWEELSPEAQASVACRYGQLPWLQEDDVPDFAGLWFSDLLLSGGPVLGPYDDKQEALDAEVAWLRAHGIPTF